MRTASPQAGWNLSVSLVKQTDAGMLLVNGPRFRDWTRPAYSPSSETEEALDAVASRVAQDIGSDPERLSTAFGIIDKFGMAGRSAVLDAADQAWAALDDTQRRSVLAVVAEKVATHRRYPEAVWALPEAELLKLEGFLDRHALPGSQPDDVELFTWAPFKRGGNLDPEEPDEQALAQARAEAIGRCLEGGTAAIFALAEAAQIPATVGDALAAATDEHDEEVLGYLGESSQPLHALAAGLAMHRQRHDDNWLRQAAQDHPERAGVLCSLAPFDQALLSLVNGLPGHAQADFWRRMYPQAIPEDLTATVVRRLLDHDRPWTAIDLLSHAGNSTNISLAVDALKAPLSNSSAEGPQSALSPQYTVGRLLDRLQDAGADEATLADLEWAYQPLLEHNRTPQALRRRLARDPGRFADLVCVMYGPEVESQDEGADDPSPKERASRANAFGAAWSVLREWRAPLPGSRDGSLPTSEDLLDWVREAQDKLTAAGRSRVLPIVLGDALCGAATDEDGTWPSRPVRDLLETLLDTELEEHLFVGKLNQRGVTVRGVYDGGEQERSLAAKYREAADKVRARWPRSGALLDGLSRSYSQDARREDRSADGQADT